MTTTPLQRMAPSIPNPVYVNETQTNQRMAPVVYVNETITTTAPATKASTQMMMGI